MKPKISECEKKQRELLRPRLDSFLNMKHELVQLSDCIDWERFVNKFGAYFYEQKGRPGLPVRLVVGLTYLKYLYNLSDENVVKHFLESPYMQYFCGYEYFQHELPCHRTSLIKWRNRLGEKGAEELLKETISVSKRRGLTKRSFVKRAIVDTTVQEKNISFPTDSKLINKARENLVKQAKREGIKLRQSYVRKGKQEATQGGRYFHAKQFKRGRRSVSKQKTWLGRVIRDIERKSPKITEEMEHHLMLANRIMRQGKKDKNKIYSLHEAHVECLSKGKAHKRYEFGNKTGFVLSGGFIIGAKSFFGNPYDGHTLNESIKQAEVISGKEIEKIYVDKGYKGKQNHPKGKEVYLSGQKRLSVAEKRHLKKRSSIEPVIGHLKQDHRLGVNYLASKIGDEINPLLAASAFNLRKAIRSFFLRFFYLLQREIGAFSKAI